MQDDLPEELRSSRSRRPHPGSADAEETVVRQPTWVRLTAVVALVALLGFVLLQIL